MRFLSIGIVFVACATSFHAARPASAAAFATVSQTPPETPPADAYAELVRAYVQVEVEYGRRLQELRASGADTASLRHPALDYYPRFEALAASDGRALLWLASHEASGHPDRTREENRAAAWARYELVVAQHVQSPCMRDFARTTSALYAEFGAEKVDALVDRAIAACKDREAVAELAYRAAGEARRSKNEARAQALTERLAKEFADTQYGKRSAGTALAAAMGAKGVGFNVGQLAPDFTTTDVDGKEFKLGDYRGKVVVLDFWGFW